MEETSSALSESVVDYVIDQVARNHFKVGDKLPPERDLSAQLRVSRATVREAIKVLNYLGYVSSTQGSGNYITNTYDLTVTKIIHTMYRTGDIASSDINVFRQCLELQAMELAISQINEDQKRELCRIVELMGATKDEDLFITLDERLHRILLLASNNPLIIINYSALASINGDYMGEFCYKRMQRKERGFEQLQIYHEQIVNALVEGDLNTGLQAIRNHFSWIY